MFEGGMADVDGLAAPGRRRSWWPPGSLRRSADRSRPATTCGRCAASPPRTWRAEAGPVGCPAGRRGRRSVPACGRPISFRARLARRAGSRAAAGAPQPGTVDPPPPPRPGGKWGLGGPPATGDDAPAGPQHAAAVPLPEPGQPLGFAAHIRSLFRERGRQPMSSAFDLSAYDNVRSRAAAISQRLLRGSMRHDHAWPAGRAEVSGRWLDPGMQP